MLEVSLEQLQRRKSLNLSTGLGQRAPYISTTMTTVRTITVQWLTIWTNDLVESGPIFLHPNTGKRGLSTPTWIGTEGRHPSELQEMTNSFKISDLVKIIISSMQKPPQESLQWDTKKNAAVGLCTIYQKGWQEWMLLLNPKINWILCNHPSFVLYNIIKCHIYICYTWYLLSFR